MSRQPGHRLHSLSEMQLMSQNSAQRAAGRVDVLEKAMGALQRKQGEIEASVLQVIDALSQQQTAIETLQALDSAVSRLDETSTLFANALARLEVRIVALEQLPKRIATDATAPKRKPGRPKGSKNKPKAAPTAEAVPTAPETAPGEAAE